MKDSEIYRRAAELIDMGSERFACNSIEIVCKFTAGCSWGETDAILDQFQNAMRPNRLPLNHEAYGWYGKPVDARNAPITERQECRVLALCFMAAIAESEGR